MALGRGEGIMNWWGRSFRSIGLSRFLQTRLNVCLMRWLPFALSRAYVNVVGRLYYAVNPGERNEISDNLCAVLGHLLSGYSVHQTVRRAFRGIFAHYHEKLVTAYARVEKVYRFVQERIEFQAEDLLVDALSRGRGVILVTAHFGGIEFMPVILALKGYRVTMVARFRTEHLKQALVPRGDDLGIKLLDAGNGDGVLFKALESLRENRILITQCDEFEAWRPAQKKWVAFLGCSCPRDRTLELLHRRYRSPVIMALNRRVTGTRYRLELNDLTAPEHGSGSEDIQQRALRILEQDIYEAPEQWYQWKNIRMILGTQIFAEKGLVFASEESTSLRIPDSALHVYD
jgi:KDO2-lipid IV(A) lauroyltransferase